MKINLLARHCNFSANSANKKNRPEWFDKEKIFQSLMNSIEDDERINVTILFDGDVSTHFLKNEKRCKIVEKKGGNDGQSFLNLLEYTKAQNYSDGDIIYFVEDDYFHRAGWQDVLIDGFEHLSCDYFTLYDHNDKYTYTAYETLQSSIYPTKYCHWRTCPSTTNTYAMLASTFRKHYQHHVDYCDLSRGYTRDHDKFLNLWKIGSNLVSSIPGYSTHCENEYMSPVVDWALKFKNLTYDYDMSNR